MRVAMQKVAGVEKVEVRLNQGLTVLDLKPANTVTVASLRQVIRNNGFTTPEARVIVLGTASVAAGRLVFETSGSRERFPIVTSAAQPELIDDLRRRALAGPMTNVEVGGTLLMPPKGEWTLQLTTLRAP